MLREHLRQKGGGHRIKDEDRPRQTPFGTRLCHALHPQQGEVAVRPLAGASYRSAACAVIVLISRLHVTFVSAVTYMGDAAHSASSQAAVSC